MFLFESLDKIFQFTKSEVDGRLQSRFSEPLEIKAWVKGMKEPTSFISYPAVMFQPEECKYVKKDGTLLQKISYFIVTKSTDSEAVMNTQSMIVDSFLDLLQTSPSLEGVYGDSTFLLGDRYESQTDNGISLLQLDVEYELFTEEF